MFLRECSLLTTKAKQKYLLTTEKDPYDYIDVAYEPKPAEGRQNNEVAMSKPTTKQENSGALEAQPPKEEPFAPIVVTDTSSTSLEGACPPRDGKTKVKATLTIIIFSCASYVLRGYSGRVVSFLELFTAVYCEHSIF